MGDHDMNECPGCLDESHPLHPHDAEIIAGERDRVLRLVDSRIAWHEARYANRPPDAYSAAHVASAAALEALRDLIGANQW